MEKRHRKNWIREVRKQRGLTQQELGDIVGVTGSQITMIEKGRRGLRAEMLHRIADALQCHPLDITDGPGNTIVARNDREKDVLRIMRQMEEGEQETFSAGLKAFASAREKQGLTEPAKPLDKKDDKRNR